MFSGTRLLLELIGVRNGPVFNDFQHIDEGVPFILESGRYYNVYVGLNNRQLTVSIAGVDKLVIGFVEGYVLLPFRLASCLGAVFLTSLLVHLSRPPAGALLDLSTVL